MLVEDSIYILTDPRNGDVRYVGESTQPYVRYGQHISDRTGSEKSLWIYGLSLEGLLPGIEVIETCQTDSDGKPEARAREFLWMLYFTQEGYDLLNCEVTSHQIKMFLRTLKQNIFEVFERYAVWLQVCRCYRDTPNGKMPITLDHFAPLVEKPVVILSDIEQSRVEWERALARQRKRRQRKKQQSGNTQPIDTKNETPLEKNRRLARERQKRRRERKNLKMTLASITL